MLSVLVHHANQFVTKAGIMDAAWPGLVVEESNLSVQISAIRRVLAQTPGGEHWVETLARRGYRFVGPVTVLDDGSPYGPSTSRSLSNLPEQLTSFVGRERELVELKRLLTSNRLLTLVGVGGIGKTRLALQVAVEIVDAYRDGVWFVDLAPLTDAGLVPSAVAQVLGVHEAPGTPLLTTLCAYVKGRQLLLLLDNCEHLLGSCATLVDALRRCAAKLSIIATSREPLRAPGEQIYPLPTLSLPDPIASEETMRRSEAVQLFVERAAKQQPGFALNATRATAIAELCIHLDGIPLALELAAARINSLSIEEINARLTDRFKLLTGGTRTAPPRQQTLRSLIDWSYDLLCNGEKVLLCRLSVFSGGWMLEAAEYVCGAKVIDERDVLDLLTSLADRNLVAAEERNRATRYRLLETVREYARERLAESEDELAVRIRHRDYFLALAEQAEPKMLLGAEQAEWLQRLDDEHENLRMALEFSVAKGQSVASLRFCGTLRRFWFMRGHLSEGRQWCVRVLGMQGVEMRTPERAKALDTAGVLAHYQADYSAARAWLEESLAIGRQLADLKAMASSLNNLGNVIYAQGDYPNAAVLHKESLAIRQKLGDRRGTASSLNNLGNLASDQLDFGSALALYNECLAIMRELGNRGGIANTLNNLGNVAYAQGNYLAARALYEECLPIQRELGNRLGVADILHMLGDVNYEQGDYHAALARYEEALALVRELGHKGRISTSLAGLAAVVACLGSPIRAARIWGAAERLREEIGSPLSPRDQPRYDRRVDAARKAAADDVAFDRSRQEGRALNPEQAIEAALQDTVGRR